MTAVSVEDITELFEDFFAELPCEHSQHQEKHIVEESAEFIFEAHCPNCKQMARYLICRSGVLRMTDSTKILGCSCGYASAPERFKARYIPL